jgi:hypothetical protein
VHHQSRILSIQQRQRKRHSSKIITCYGHHSNTIECWLLRHFGGRNLPATHLRMGRRDHHLVRLYYLNRLIVLSREEPMWRVHLSRRINHRLFRGHQHEMLSSRIHRESWRCEPVVNAIFFWHNRHCERCYRWEVQHAQANQKTARPPEEAPSHH